MVAINIFSTMIFPLLLIFLHNYTLYLYITDLWIFTGSEGVLFILIFLVLRVVLRVLLWVIMRSLPSWIWQLSWQLESPLQLYLHIYWYSFDIFWLLKCAGIYYQWIYAEDFMKLYKTYMETDFWTSRLVIIGFLEVFYISGNIYLEEQFTYTIYTLTIIFKDFRT